MMALASEPVLSASYRSMDASWSRASQAALLLSVDPARLKGAWVKTSAGPVRDEWDRLLRSTMPERSRRRIAPNITDEALFGGLDLTATLSAKERHFKTGLLEAPAALLTLPIGERTPTDIAAKIAASLDRDVGHAVQAFDASQDEETGLPTVLAERLAFWISLEGVSYRDCSSALVDLAARDAAREFLPKVVVSCEIIETIMQITADFAITGFHAPILAVAAARAAAAIDQSVEITPQHTALAVDLVLAPRARARPDWIVDEADREEPPQTDDAPDPEQNHEETPDPDQDPEQGQEQDQAQERDLLLDAVKAALPETLLDQLRTGGSVHRAPSSGSGSIAKGAARGRPLPARRGKPSGRNRIDLLETLKAAAPWQTLRTGTTRPQTRRATPNAGGIAFRSQDLRVRRFKSRGERLVIFLVDASGSAAIARLAEAKGAVEMLLAQAYSRRDSVALLAFRGTNAEEILPPTRSLVRAKRSLAGLPGGGATPLATGLQLAYRTALQATSRGMTPAIVIMTDGRGNVALSGDMDRKQALEDAERTARLIAASQIVSLVVDTANRPSKPAKEIAATLNGDYFALPRADPNALSEAIRASLPSNS